MSKRAGRSGGKFLAGHQRSWIWGRHAVLEILEAARWPMAELYLSLELPDEARASATVKAKKTGASIAEAPHERLRELCGTGDHQGYLARMGPFPYAARSEFDAMLRRSADGSLCILLDRMRDPHNYGAIIRSAAALGAMAVIVPENGQAPVNNHVARASAGAVNKLPIVQVGDLMETLHACRRAGFSIVAAVQGAAQSPWTHDFRNPSLLIFGNEGEGIDPGLLAAADTKIGIPQSTTVNSMNVASAAAVLLYEAARQRAVGQQHSAET